MLLWVNLRCLPGAHHVNLSFPILSKEGEENKMKKFMGWDEYRKIFHQLPSQTKQTWPWEY